MKRICGGTCVSAIALVALAACGGGHHSPAPLARNDFVESGGRPVLGSSPGGVTLRFVPSASFGVGIVLRNRARERVAIEDVRAVEPPRSLVHQLGTRLQRWDPPRCTGGRSCPAIGFLRAPYTADRPVPVTVAPGGLAAVQLAFRLGNCAAVALASPAAPERITVSFHYEGGDRRSQTLALGPARLLLRTPTPADCAPVPHSHIALDGAVATSSDWTVPGSSGDICTLGNRGGLLFRSRLYRAPGKRTTRVTLRLPRFAGPGLYRTLRTGAPALGPAQVRVTTGVGTRGRKTFRPRTSVVTVTRVTPTELRGSFHATFAGRGGSEFRAYGAWHCSRG